MEKQFNELSASVKKQVNELTSKLKGKEMLVVELDSNNAIIDTRISSVLKDIGLFVGISHEYETTGTYTKQPELEDYISSCSTRIFYKDFSRHPQQTKENKTSRDITTTTNTYVASIMNTLKGGKYDAKDIEKLEKENDVIRLFNQYSNASKTIMFEGTPVIINEDGKDVEYNISNLADLAKKIIQMQPQMQAEQTQIRALLNTSKPTKFTLEEIDEIVDLFKTRLLEVNDKYIDYKSSKNLKTISANDVVEMTNNQQEIIREVEE